MEPLGTSGFGTTIEEELSSLHCDLRQVSASIQDAKNLVIQLDTQLDELGEKVGRGAIAAGRVTHNLGKGVGGSLAIGAGVALVGFAAASVMRKWNDYQSKHRIVEVTATAREIASDRHAVVRQNLPRIRRTAERFERITKKLAAMNVDYAQPEAGSTLVETLNTAAGGWYESRLLLSSLERLDTVLARWAREDLADYTEPDSEEVFNKCVDEVAPFVLHLEEPPRLSVGELFLLGIPDHTPHVSERSKSLGTELAHYRARQRLRWRPPGVKDFDQFFQEFDAIGTRLAIAERSFWSKRAVITTVLLSPIACLAYLLLA